MTSPAVLAYPTRTGEAQMTYRQEPTVWCDPDEPPEGPLAPGQLRRYETDGFLALPRLLTENDLTGLRAAAGEALNDPGRATDPRYVRGADDDDVRRIHGIHAGCGDLARLVRDPRLAGAARQVLDSDVYVHHSRIDRAPGTFGEGCPWHSDFERWHADDGMRSMRALGVLIALSPTDEFGGALVVSPGSHRTFISCAEDDHQAAPPGWDARLDPDLYCADAVLDSCGIERVDAEPGTVVLFDSNVLHATLPNLSPDPVLSVYVAYNSVDNALVQPFNGGPPRPEYLASRDFAPIKLP